MMSTTTTACAEDRAVAFLSRGGVTVMKAVSGADVVEVVIDAARRLDSAPTTRMLGPVRLVVRDGMGVTVFDATWPTTPAVGTIDLVRRGYLSAPLVRTQGQLTPAVRLLVERIADFIMGGPEHVEPR